jgi:stress-induced-phosphoprotein 1
MNPKLAPYLDQPDYVNMIKMMQTNPQMMNAFLQDKRIMNTFAALCGLNMESMSDDAPMDEDEHPKRSPKKSPEPKHAPSSSQPSSTKQPAAGKQLTNQQAADAEKEKGNVFYKNKEFDKAIECYDKAYEICPENIVYLINKAAVYFEQQKYDECITICDSAIEKGRAERLDVKLIAKAFARKGSALHKQQKFDDAIAAFKSSLMEHRIADTLNKLNACEKDKNDMETTAYLDDAKAAEAKERGNEKFKAGDFPAAIKEYDEAIKRKPTDQTYYCNRAAAYTKLNEMQHAMADCDKALELDPKYVKAISRKANIYYWRKEYHKALRWYEEGLKVEPSNEELRKGVECTLQQIKSAQSTGEVDEDRVRKAMSDPEIQSILQDPIMQSVLRDFTENPKAAQQHLKNPGIMEKLQKLIAAGVLRTSTKQGE